MGLPRDAEPPEPEYGSWYWIFCEALRLGRRKLMPNDDTRRAFVISIQSLYFQINIVKSTDASVLYNVLLAVRDWLVKYKGAPARCQVEKYRCYL